MNKIWTLTLNIQRNESHSASSLHITGAECSPLAVLQSRDDIVQDVECLGISPEHHAASHHVHAEDGDDHEDRSNDEDENKN